MAVFFIMLSAPLSAAINNSLDDKRLCFTPTDNSIQLCKFSLHGFNEQSLMINQDYTYSKNSDNNTVLYNFIKTADKDTDYGAYFFSAFALLVSIGIPIWQRHLSKKDAIDQKKDAINDGFWVREVVMPQVNTNMFNTCTLFRNKFNLPASEFTLAYDEDLLPSLNSLRDSFSLLTAFPNATSYPDILNRLCDDFEDKVSDHINEPLNIRKDDVSSFQLALTKILIEVHKKIS